MKNSATSCEENSAAPAVQGGLDKGSNQVNPIVA